MKKGFAVMAVVGLLCLGSLAHADLFKSTFTGNGSFKLNGVSYGDSNFIITTIFDTADRQYNSDSAAYWISNESARITIQALGTYAFVTPTSIFRNTANGAVGLTRGQVLPGQGRDLYNIWNAPGAMEWDMLTPFGPVATTTGQLLQWDSWEAPVYTDAGVLEFDNKEEIFATFNAEAVPEPSSVMALLAGIGALVPFVKRKQR